MMVWLDIAGAPVGIVDGIVARESLTALVSLDEAARQLQQRQSALAQETLDAARERAEALVADAQAQAHDLMERAQREADAARSRGLLEGRAQALEAWHAEAAAHRCEAARRHADQRERLASMVVQAVQSLLDQAPAEAFFDTAVAALDGLAEQSRALVLRVHPDDEAAARASISRRGERWPDGTVVKLVTDARLQPRDCVCESPRGFVDASLSMHLAALRRAAVAALGAQGVQGDAIHDTPEDA